VPFPATEEASTIDLAVVGPDRFGECNLVEEQCTRQAQGAAQMVGPRENGDVVTQRINNIVSRVQRGCSNRSRPFNSLPPRDSHELGRIRILHSIEVRNKNKLTELTWPTSSVEADLPRRRYHPLSFRSGQHTA